MYDVRRHAAADRLTQTRFLCGIGQHSRDVRNCAADCTLTPQNGEISCSNSSEACQGSLDSSLEKYVGNMGRGCGLAFCCTAKNCKQTNVKDACATDKALEVGNGKKNIISVLFVLFYYLDLITIKVYSRYFVQKQI